MANDLDLSAAWHAHAPPPPPPMPAAARSRSPSPSKPRRRSSFDPAALSASTPGKGHGFDPHTQGGVLPPDSFSPEPPTSRSTRNTTAPSSSSSASASASTPSSPVKRHRSKVGSNPAPPAPSALYNYKHQQQQALHYHHHHHHHQQQPQQPPYQPHQHVQYQQQYQQPGPQHQQPYSALPPHLDHAHNNGAGYTRSRYDSSPYPMAAASAATAVQGVQQGYALPSPGQHAAPLPPAAPGAGAYGIPPYHPQQAPAGAPPPAGYGQPAVYQPAQQMLPQMQQGYAAPATSAAGWSAYAAAHPYAAQQQQPGAPAQYAQAPVPSSSYYTTPPQQHVATFSSPHAQPQQPQQQQQPLPAEPAHAFPTMSPTAAPPALPPTQPSSAFDSSTLSRQSTVSSVGSVRRPLPQPTRTISLTSAPTSPLANGQAGSPTAGSVRRGLPRVPPGANASQSSGTTSPPSGDSPQGSPKLPLSTLNRTESVRLAAEALMARGVPQRRPLRSALRNTTFASPHAAESDQSRPAQDATAAAAALSASQSEPVAPGPGVSHAGYGFAAGQGGAPSPSQSAGPGIPSAVGQQPWTANSGSVPAQAAAPMVRQESAPVHSAPPPPPPSVPSHSQPPASYQNAVEQAQRRRQSSPSLTQQPPALAESFAQMSMRGHGRDRATAYQDEESPATSPPKPAPPAVVVAPPSIAVTADDGHEEPRRRGGSVSRAQARPAPPSIPTISLPGDGDGENDDGGAGCGPVISISGPEDDDNDQRGGARKGSSSNGGGGGISVPSISIGGAGDDDDDDRRSQTSNGSKGPSVSISFSGDPSGGAKPQQAKTTEGPYARSARDHGAASSSSVGGGAQCYACRKYIAGKVVHALGTTFHPSCFVCAHCSEGLEHVAFYEKDGLPYCHFDYHEQFSRRCFHCRTPIVDERFITVQDEELTGGDEGGAKERCYHELHFFCANCGDPFLDPKAAGSAAGADPSLVAADDEGRVKAGGMEFIVHKGYPYCEKCHINLHKPRCKSCRNPVVGDLITALGAKYHPECFVCDRCRRPFEDTSFFVRDGKAYDEACYKVILRSLV